MSHRDTFVYSTYGLLYSVVAKMALNSSQTGSTNLPKMIASSSQSILISININKLYPSYFKEKSGGSAGGNII